jgi:hypothetical protein
MIGDFCRLSPTHVRAYAGAARYAEDIWGAMSFDSTMKFSTTMNRTEIENMLARVSCFCASRRPAGSRRPLDRRINGLPQRELQSRITRCLERLGGKDEYGLFIDKLNMLRMNLRNLK